MFDAAYQLNTVHSPQEQVATFPTSGQL